MYNACTYVVCRQSCAKYTVKHRINHALCWSASSPDSAITVPLVCPSVLGHVLPLTTPGWCSFAYDVSYCFSLRRHPPWSPKDASCCVCQETLSWKYVRCQAFSVCVCVLAWSSSSMSGSCCPQYWHIQYIIVVVVTSEMSGWAVLSGTESCCLSSCQPHCWGSPKSELICVHTYLYTLFMYMYMYM